MAINIIKARCPRCAKSIELTITATPILTQTMPGRKCFITAQVSSSGVEHTCMESMKPWEQELLEQTLKGKSP